MQERRNSSALAMELRMSLHLVNAYIDEKIWKQIDPCIIITHKMKLPRLYI